jgi:hypothetical protein
MTTQPLQSPPIGVSIPPWAALTFALALAVQLVTVVSWGARVEARTSELYATTEPIRRGDLVAIQRDVAWIRERLEREDGK